MLKMRKLVLDSIMHIQPAAICPDPQYPASIFIDGKNVIVAQTCRIRGIILVVDEFLL